MGFIRTIIQAIDTAGGLDASPQDIVRTPPEDASAGVKSRILAAAMALSAATTVGVSWAIFPGSFVWAFQPVLTAALLVVMTILPVVAVVICIPRFEQCCRTLWARSDSEHEQIILRVIMLSMVDAFLGAMVLTSDYHDGLILALVAMAVGHSFAWSQMIHILLRPARSKVRRILGIFADQWILSFVLLTGGEEAAAFYLIYLWVTLGNGFRYGVMSLVISAVVSATGFGCVVALSDYWNQHLYAGIGLLAALLVLPAYVMPLIGRLNRARAQAEEANRAKGRFLATMSHELRTPLTAIIGMSGLLKSTRITEEQSGMVAAVDTSAQSLLGLINEILDFSKIEAGKLTVHADPFNLHEVVARIWTMLHGQAEQKGLRLRITMDPAVASHLRGDSKRLGQILINLVGNAIKFTESGEVELSVRVQGTYSGEMLILFEVTDTGIGISEEKLASVFEGFTQADDTIGRRYGGTGLGLAITKQLVEMMGGRIGVRSTLGEGSTFWLTIPFETIGETRGPVETRGAPVMLICSDQGVTDRLFLTMANWRVEPVIVEHKETLRSILSDDGAMGGTIVIANDCADDPLVSTFLDMVRTRRPDSQPAIIEMVAHEPEDAALAARQWPVSIAIVTADVETGLRNALQAALAIKARWPARLQEAGDDGDAVSGPAHVAPGRILLAEDNNTNRMVITRILENGGHTVVPATDGDQALDLLAQEAFDIALMDVNMPGTSGLDVVRIHRMSESRDDHLPIVALTADATEQARRDCADAGMDDYLTKPVEPDRLFAMIAKFVAADVEVAEASTGPGPQSDEIVTPISHHPRYRTITEPVLDRSALNALRILDTDGSFFVEVITEFMSDSESIISDMATACEAKDAAAFRDAAHSLRSSANHVGASRMVKMLLDLREVRHDDLGESGRPVIQGLRAEFKKIRTALERELGKQRRSRSGR